MRREKIDNVKRRNNGRQRQPRHHNDLDDDHVIWLYCKHELRSHYSDINRVNKTLYVNQSLPPSPRRKAGNDMWRAVQLPLALLLLLLLLHACTDHDILSKFSNCLPRDVLTVVVVVVR